MTLVHILRRRNSISCVGEMHIPRGRRYWVNKKILFCLFLFMFVFLFSLWCFELCLVFILCCYHCICLCVGHLYILMLLCFIECMFGWSFTLLCDHCSHFFMTVLVYDQVAHMFHIIIYLLHYTCPFITCFTLRV